MCAKRLTVEWVLDTHSHADHFSAAPYLAEKTGGKTAIGAKVIEVQKLWQDIYCLPDLPVDGSQWDRLFADGEQFRIGSLDAHVMLSPGHTLASITYVVGDASFVHDTLMVPDSGTSRADFPGGDARALWRSIRAILDLRLKPPPMSGMTTARTVAGSRPLDRGGPAPRQHPCARRHRRGGVRGDPRSATLRCHYPT
jgi:glyoxylase-like metal-dependent hydrolase (beta-lactamase superfamily II)